MRSLRRHAALVSVGLLVLGLACRREAEIARSNQAHRSANVPAVELDASSSRLISISWRPNTMPVCIA